MKNSSGKDFVAHSAEINVEDSKLKAKKHEKF
jgi:hypothetical protein